MDPTCQDLLKRIEALEQQLSQNQLLLRDSEGRVRVRLAEDGLQLLDAAGTVRAELSVDTHSTRLEITGTGGASVRLTAAANESVVLVKSNRMHWYTGLSDSENLAVQRITDAEGIPRLKSEIFGDYASIIVRSADNEWVWINTVKGAPAELLIKTSPHEAWSAPSLSTMQMSHGSSRLVVHDTPQAPTPNDAAKD